jgi:excisionase family DNA binding protein
MILSPALAPAAHMLLAIPDVADRLGISTKSVRRMIARGELRAHRIGRLIRVSEADYHNYVVERRQNNGMGSR